MPSHTPVDVLHLIAKIVAASPDCQNTIYSCCLVNTSFCEAFTPFFTRHVRFRPPLRILRRAGPADAGPPIDQGRQTSLLSRLSRLAKAIGFDRVMSFEIVLYSDPNDPLEERAIDLLASLLAHATSLTSLSLSVVGDPLGIERAIYSLRHPALIRDLEILVQFDPWIDLFGAVPEDFLSDCSSCNHPGSAELRQRRLEYAEDVALPCRHRFDFNWSFLEMFRKLDRLNLQGLSGDFSQVVADIAQILIASRDMKEIGLGESISGFTSSRVGTLIDIRPAVNRQVPWLSPWQGTILPRAKKVKLGDGYIPSEWNQWGSFHMSGDLGWALEWLFSHAFGKRGVEELTVHNTQCLLLPDPKTGLVEVKGRPYDMVDNPWRNYDYGFRKGIKHFRVDVLTRDLCEVIMAAAGNDAFLPGNQTIQVGTDIHGYNSLVIRPDGTSFVLEWRNIDFSDEESQEMENPLHPSSGMWHYWRLD